MRRRKRDTVLAGRDTFVVLDSAGAQLAVKGAAPHALNAAQHAAEKAEGKIVLTVDRRSLFGPPVTLYHVTRTEDGIVFTDANPED